MKKLIIAAGLLMTTSAYAQTEVLTGVTRGKDYGVVYSLPKTQIELEIKANKVNYTPGEFSKYADRYLRLTNVSADPEEYWELASVKVKSVGVPNSETTYFVKLKDKTVAPLMELTEDGIVKTINVLIIRHARCYKLTELTFTGNIQSVGRLVHQQKRSVCSKRKAHEYFLFLSHRK